MKSPAADKTTRVIASDLVDPTDDHNRKVTGKNGRVVRSMRRARATNYSSKGPSAIDQIVKPDLVALGNLIASLQATGSRLVQTYPANRPAVSSY